MWSSRPKAPVVSQTTRQLSGCAPVEHAVFAPQGADETIAEAKAALAELRVQFKALLAEGKAFDQDTPWHRECRKLASQLDEAENLIDNPRIELGFVPVGETEIKWGFHDDPLVSEALNAALAAHNTENGDFVYKVAHEVDIKDLLRKTATAYKTFDRQSEIYQELWAEKLPDEAMLVENECSACGKSARLGCDRCRIHFYCSPTCQKANWSQHRFFCKTFLSTYHKAPTVELSRKEKAEQDAFFMEKIKDIDVDDIDEKLHYAVSLNRPALVRHFLILGADANTQMGPPGNAHVIFTPLMAATKNGSAAIVKMLLAWGATPDAVADSSIRENSPLLVASMDGSVDIVRMLVAASADVKVADSKEATALSLVCCKHMSNSAQVVKLLVDAGCDLEHADIVGMTPLLLAVCADSAACVKVLLEAGANANAMSHQGSTPLIHAVQNVNMPIIALLVGAGADPLLVQRPGMMSALDLVKAGSGQVQGTSQNVIMDYFVSVFGPEILRK